MHEYCDFIQMEYKKYRYTLNFLQLHKYVSVKYTICVCTAQMIVADQQPCTYVCQLPRSVLKRLCDALIEKSGWLNLGRFSIFQVQIALNVLFTSTY